MCHWPRFQYSLTDEHPGRAGAVLGRREVTAKGTSLRAGQARLEVKNENANAFHMRLFPGQAGNQQARGNDLQSCLSMLEPLNEQTQALDARLGEIALKDVRVRRMMTMPQIGPVTAVSFVATLGDAGRFRGAHQVEADLGLVPREWSSSEVQRRGRITKAGNSRMRWLLVEAAWRVATHKKRPETQSPAGVGGSDRAPAWPTGRHGGPRAEAERDSLRDVEGRLSVRPRQTQRCAEDKL